MWMLSVAMAIKNTGAIELMMWMGNPSPIRRPMLQRMAIMASIMSAMERNRSPNMR